MNLVENPLGFNTFSFFVKMTAVKKIFIIERLTELRSILTKILVKHQSFSCHFCSGYFQLIGHFTLFDLSSILIG